MTSTSVKKNMKIPGKAAIGLPQSFQHSVSFVSTFLSKLIGMRDVLPVPLSDRFRADQHPNAIAIFSQQFKRLKWAGVSPKQLIGIHLCIHEIAIIWTKNFAQFNSAHGCWPTTI